MALHLWFTSQRGGFWRDEIHELSLARLDAWNFVRHDSFPALAAVALHGWTRVAGHGDDALRAFGLLAGLSVIALLWIAARRVGQTPPLLALALFALNPVVIRYGDSLRGYGLGCACLLGFLAMTWAWLQKVSLPRWLALAALAALSVQTLYQNAVLVAAVCAGAAVVCLRHRLWRVLAGLFAAGAFAAATLLVYADNLAAGNGAVVAGAQRAWKLAHLVKPLAAGLDFPFSNFSWLWLVLAVVVVGCGFLSLRPRLATGGAAGPADLPLFAAVVLLVAAMGYCWFLSRAAVVTRPWHFIPLLALAAICFDLGLAALPRLGRLAVLVLALALAGVAAPLAGRELQTRFTNLDWVAWKLSATTKPGDYILVTPWHMGITFDRYFQGRAAWDTIPPVSDHTLNRMDQAMEQMKNPHAIAPVLEKVSATLQAGGRVWLVGDVDIPAVATPAPADLPPPPLKWTGWLDTPYNLVWDMQIAHFLRDHAQTFEAVPDGLSQPVSELEKLPLRRAEGWRTDVVSPPPVALPIR